jgi:sulfur transfer protein SufE
VGQHLFQKLINLTFQINQRYKELLFYATKLAPLPPEDHIPENKVQGCASQVRWQVTPLTVCLKYAENSPSLNKRVGL